MVKVNIYLNIEDIKGLWFGKLKDQWQYINIIGEIKELIEVCIKQWFDGLGKLKDMWEDGDLVA